MTGYKQEFRDTEVRAVPRVSTEVRISPEAEKIMEKAKFNGGGTSSHEALRYDLIPREGLKVLAQRYTLGLKFHGARNYRKSLRDKQFMIDRLNHIQEHYQKLVSPRKEDGKDFEGSHREIIENHLGAIMWGCCFLAEILADEEASNILINEVIDWG